jgi:FkbM family methyltransferase
MSFPFKDLTFLGDRFRIYGPSVEDRYFQILHDDMEPEFVRFCRSFVRPDHICLDVGANIGVKSLIMAAQARHGRVIAMEPGPSIAPALELNMQANQAANVTVEKVAIGDRTGATVRFREESAFGFVSDTGVEVPMTTLATLAERLDLPRVDFIKMDVEGLEFEILKSSVDFINRNDALVYFEFNAWTQMTNADVHPKEFAKWLLGTFSNVYVVKKSGDYGELLWRIGKDEWRAILYHNCFHSDFVNDIVVTNAPWRLEAARDAATLERNHQAARRREETAEREAIREARDIARAQLATARAERDAMRAQLDALQNSTSWKITSGLRAIGRILKPRA